MPMRPRTPFPRDAVHRMKTLQRNAESKIVYQRVTCILFRAANPEVPANQVATVVGYHPDYVRQLWARFLREGEGFLLEDRRGGRYNENLTMVEERAFLRPFLRAAERGGVLVVNDIKQSYEKKLKRNVPTSTVYAMLHRNGWRKICPRPGHPQGDAIAREVFQASFPPPGSTHRLDGRGAGSASLGALRR